MDTKLTFGIIACILLAIILQPLFGKPTHPQGFREHWSAWRRRHQATAQRCHYQRQATQMA